MKAFVTRLGVWFGITFFLFMPAAGKAETLKVAFAHWPPWKIVGDHRIEGIDADIVRAIAKQLNLSVDFTICPWRRCIEMAKKGDIDLITSFGRTPSREKFVYYLGPPYIVEHVAFYVRADQAITIKKYRDLHDIKIGAIKGASYFSEFDDDRLLEKTAVNLEQQLFEMLEAGRIDMFIGFETVVDYLILKEGFEGRFKKSSFIVASTGSHIAMPKQSGAVRWREDITKQVALMASRGEFRRIIDGFFRKMVHRKPRPQGEQAQ